jgi:acyl-CoA reductase-like NAD-dependent aldehyde dehydrogenase
MAQETLKKRPAKPAIRQTRHLIDNKWVDPVEGGQFETLNPATGEVIAEVAAGTAADV